MPWVVLNLGSEMIYILEQRLKAQGIQPEKSAKVLQDIVRTMFDCSFLSEKLFVPQEMYSLHSTRKIFDRLAHSSIMRLSEARCLRKGAVQQQQHVNSCSPGIAHSNAGTAGTAAWTSCLT